MLSEAGPVLTPRAGGRKVLSAVGKVPGRNTHTHDSSPVLRVQSKGEGGGDAPLSALAYCDEITTNLFKSGRKQGLGFQMELRLVAGRKEVLSRLGTGATPPSPVKGSLSNSSGTPILERR